MLARWYSIFAHKALFRGHTSDRFRRYGVVGGVRIIAWRQKPSFLIKCGIMRTRNRQRILLLLLCVHARFARTNYMHKLGLCTKLRIFKRNCTVIRDYYGERLNRYRKFYSNIEIQHYRRNKQRLTTMQQILKYWDFFVFCFFFFQ